MRRGRENKCIGLVVEEDPGPIGSELLEAESAEDPGVAQMVKLPGIGRNGGEGFGRGSRAQQREFEEDDRTTIVDADCAQPCRAIGREKPELDLSIVTREVPARFRSQFGNW